MRKAALLDADETLLEGLTLFPLCDALAADAVITNPDNERIQSAFERYKNGEIAYNEAVKLSLEASATALAGKTDDAAYRVARDFYGSDRVRTFGYVEPSLDALRQAEFDIVVITAEPAFAAKAISANLHANRYFATEFGLDRSGNFTGKIAHMLGSSDKGGLAAMLKRQYGLIWAAGDSDGDIAMLEVADQAYCIRPSGNLASVALKNEWNIITDPDNVRNIFTDL